MHWYLKTYLIYDYTPTVCSKIFVYLIYEMLFGCMTFCNLEIAATEKMEK